MTDPKYEFVPKEDFDTAMRALRSALDEAERLRSYLDAARRDNDRLARRMSEGGEADGRDEG